MMGLMLGKIDGDTMIVMDSFALPVEGTETRVNAQAQAYEYMTAYVESAKQVMREKEEVVVCQQEMISLCTMCMQEFRSDSLLLFNEL